jgi:hypothetical protein
VARLGPRGRRHRRYAEPREFSLWLHEDANLCGDDGGLCTHKWPISRSGWKLGEAGPTIPALAPLNGSAHRESQKDHMHTHDGLGFIFIFVVVVVFGGGVIIHFDAAGY